MVLYMYLPSFSVPVPGCYGVTVLSAAWDECSKPAGRLIYYYYLPI